MLQNNLFKSNYRTQKLIYILLTNVSIKSCISECKYFSSGGKSYDEMRLSKKDTDILSERSYGCTLYIPSLDSWYKKIFPFPRSLLFDVKCRSLNKL